MLNFWAHLALQLPRRFGRTPGPVGPARHVPKSTPDQVFNSLLKSEIRTFTPLRPSFDFRVHASHPQDRRDLQLPFDRSAAAEAPGSARTPARGQALEGRGGAAGHRRGAPAHRRGAQARGGDDGTHARAEHRTGAARPDAARCLGGRDRQWPCVGPQGRQHHPQRPEGRPRLRRRLVGRHRPLGQRPLGGQRLSHADRHRYAAEVGHRDLPRCRRHALRGAVHERRPHRVQARACLARACDPGARPRLRRRPSRARNRPTWTC